MMTRQKTEAECRVEQMLLGSEDWYYGNKAHVFVHDIDWHTDHASREYFDADTWEPLTSKQVAGRIETYNITQGMK